ncbi:MAG TPA: TIGR03435 family protein [Verrucomicrobiae bacterium]|nr:TIGR03435 family protein [Verrucomicrobiae bacterium]
MDDFELLRQFAADGSETAFTALVERHLHLVHAAAWRQARDAHLAEEITQAVFILLARKAKTISRKTILTGWFYRTTHFVAADALKAQRRRQWREQQAARMQTDFENAERAAANSAWEQIAPHLDEAMAKLGSKDRDAVLLRFFENKSFAQVGAALGVNEDAARKRIVRALEKLRRHFSRRSVTLAATLIAGSIAANSVSAVPAISAQTISAIALAKGAAAGGSTLTLVKGALKLMAWTKAKTAIVAGVVVLLAAGTTTVTVKEIQKHKTYSWQQLKDFRPPWSFEKMPQQVEILPTEKKLQTYPGPWARENIENDARFIGIAQPIQTIIECAFHVQYPNRVVYSVELPTNKYDFIATLPHNSGLAMQQEIKKKFGVIGEFETIRTNALLLVVKYPNSAGLKPSTTKVGSNSTGNGMISVENENMNGLAFLIENHFKIPVIDQTGLTKFFDFEISWDDYKGGYPNLNGFKQALLNQLGLELVPTNMPIEMLVVEKAP